MRAEKNVVDVIGGLPTGCPGLSTGQYVHITSIQVKQRPLLRSLTIHQRSIYLSNKRCDVSSAVECSKLDGPRGNRILRLKDMIVCNVGALSSMALAGNHLARQLHTFRLRVPFCRWELQS